MKKTFHPGYISGIISLLRGLQITMKNLCTRAITLQYPSQRMPMTAAYRGLVDLKTANCTICLQCQKICPTSCLSITAERDTDNKRKLAAFGYKMEYCCFCGLCEQVCPSDAIYMNKIYEITSYNRQDLDIDLLKEDKYLEWDRTTT